MLYEIYLGIGVSVRYLEAEKLVFHSTLYRVVIIVMIKVPKGLKSDQLQKVVKK
jgi:hypothetical protein